MIADWSMEPNGNDVEQAREQLNSAPEKAIEKLSELSDEGSHIARWILGDAYMSGRNIPRDLERARFWYDKFAAPERPFGFHMLGRIAFEIGDLRDARIWFEKASRAGYLPSEYRLGMLLIEHYSETFLVEGKTLLTDAAKRGHLFARRDLATMYIKGAFGIFQIPFGIFYIISFLLDLLVTTFRGGLSEFDERVIT